MPYQSYHFPKPPILFQAVLSRDRAFSRNTLQSMTNISRRFWPSPDTKKAPASCEAGADTMRTLPVERRLEAGGHVERHAPVRGNRHLFAGLRIAPALPAAHHRNQHAEAAHHDAVAVRQGFRHRFKEGVDRRPALFQAYAQTGRKSTGKPHF